MANWEMRDGVIRVVVVDDSLTARELLVAVLQDADGVEVVAVGYNGEDAVRLAHRMKPDVLVIDVDMPLLDGLQATRRIMNELPTPIVLVTGTLMHTDLTLGFKALQAGALTVLSKPGMMDAAACAELVQTVRSMGRVPVVRRWKKPSPQALPRTGPLPPLTPLPRQAISPALYSRLEERMASCTIAGIAASTGGPAALAHLLEKLPTDYPMPILIVQHVTQGFAPGLAEWLDSTTDLPVRLAAHGWEPEPGEVLIAPDDYHLGLNDQHQVELSKEPPYLSLRPSANHLFESLARVYGSRALGIILTGMGDDGAKGLATLRQTGAVTLAQDRESSIVYGMPREAVLRGAADFELPLQEIALLLKRCRKQRTYSRTPATGSSTLRGR